MICREIIKFFQENPPSSTMTASEVDERMKEFSKRASQANFHGYDRFLDAAVQRLAEVIKGTLGED